MNITNPTIFNIQQILYKSELVTSMNSKCVQIIENIPNKVGCIISAIINILKSINKIYDQQFKFIKEQNMRDFKISSMEINLAVSIILNTKNIVITKILLF